MEELNRFWREAELKLVTQAREDREALERERDVREQAMAEMLSRLEYAQAQIETLRQAQLDREREQAERLEELNRFWREAELKLVAQARDDREAMERLLRENITVVEGQLDHWRQYAQKMRADIEKRQARLGGRILNVLKPWHPDSSSVSFVHK